MHDEDLRLKLGNDTGEVEVVSGRYISRYHNELVYSSNEGKQVAYSTTT